MDNLRPYSHLVRQLESSPDLKDQALAVLLKEMSQQSLTLYGRPDEAEGGLVGRIHSLEVSRNRWRRFGLAAIPTILFLLFSGIGAWKTLRDLIAQRREPVIYVYPYQSGPTTTATGPVQAQPQLQPQPQPQETFNER